MLQFLCLSDFFIQNNYKFSSSSLYLYAIFIIPFQSLELIEVFCRIRNLEAIIQMEDWGTLDILKCNSNTKIYFLQVYRCMEPWLLTEFYAVFNIKCCIYPCHQIYYGGLYHQPDKTVEKNSREEGVSVYIQLFYIQMNAKSRNTLL